VLLPTGGMYSHLEVLIDDEDWERCKPYSWNIAWDKEADYFYVKTYDWKTQKTLYLARFLCCCFDSNQVDHKDLNPLNNQKTNLRICSRLQNSQNKQKQKNNSSGYRGVYWCKSSKCWKASIRVNKQRIYLGGYSTPEQAAEAYKQASLKYHGKFGRI